MYRVRELYGCTEQPNTGVKWTPLQLAAKIREIERDDPNLAGKTQTHNRLAFDESGKAMLYVFSTCRQFIRTMPALVYSVHDVEDVDTSCEDHIYDETRYVAMERKITPRAPAAIKKQEYNPLEEDQYARSIAF